MISKKTKYGLHALIHLAQKRESGVVLIEDLAREKHIPKKFLEAILLELKKKGILQSKKGKGGGYSLARHPRDIYMGEVVRLLDGPIAPVSCVSQSAYQKCDECQDEVTCGIRIVMKDVREAMSQILDHTSLEDVLEKMESYKGNKAFEYFI